MEGGNPPFPLICFPLVLRKNPFAMGGGVPPCHLPKYYTFGFGMVFKFLGQLLKQSNVFGNKITRFGVNGYNSCQEVKVKLDPSVKIGQCLNILILLQNKCVLDAR